MRSVLLGIGIFVLIFAAFAAWNFLRRSGPALMVALAVVGLSLLVGVAMLLSAPHTVTVRAYGLRIEAWFRRPRWIPWDEVAYVSLWTGPAKGNARMVSLRGPGKTFVFSDADYSNVDSLIEAAQRHIPDRLEDSRALSGSV